MLRRASCWVALSAALVGCTGDEFGAGSGGAGSGGGAATVTGTSTGTEATTATSTGTGAGCPGGCLGDGVCREGTSEAFCGTDGGACQVCTDPPDECSRAACDGTCTVVPRQEGALCSNGAGTCRSGSCVISGENCLDGVDNEDEDSDIDCNDTDCAGFVCTDPAPAGGWAGPFLVFASDAPVACPAGLANSLTLYGEPDAGTCECEAPTFGECTATLGIAAACKAASTLQEVGAACSNAAFGGATFAVDGATTAGTCTATGSVNDGVSPVFTECTVNGGGCDNRQACAPPIDPPSNGEALLCIRGPGNAGACPGDFPLPREAWINDDYGCDCSCDVEANTCSGQVETFTDGACSECTLGTCPTLAVPDAACSVNLAGGPVHGKLVGVVEGDMTATPGQVGRAVEADALYCCQAYPMP